MPVSKALRDALRWGAEERRDLTDAFLEHKITTYIETLGDLARAHGADVADDDIVLSDDVLRALRDESVEHAGFVVDTFNRDLDAFLERNADLPRAQLLDTYDAWAADRADARAELIAVTEAYPAHADATMAFFRDNEIEPEFEFGGHPGDDPPSCEVCQALVATNPHPLERVVEIGSPHINCRQSWGATGDYNLPDELVLGEKPAGIVGRDALVNRAGDQAAAVSEIERLAGVSISRE